MNAVIFCVKRIKILINLYLPQIVHVYSRCILLLKFVDKNVHVIAMQNY